MILSKYSMGIGDRFARQGQAQLRALIEAKALGVDIAPVWNKSNREHPIVHTHPDSVRAEADAAVKALGWKGPYYVDADHIGLKNVDNFIKAQRLLHARRGGLHRASRRRRPRSRRSWRATERTPAR